MHSINITLPSFTRLKTFVSYARLENNKGIQLTMYTKTKDTCSWHSSRRNSLMCPFRLYRFKAAYFCLIPCLNYHLFCRELAPCTNVFYSFYLLKLWYKKICRIFMTRGMCWFTYLIQFCFKLFLYLRKKSVSDIYNKNYINPK